MFSLNGSPTLWTICSCCRLNPIVQECHPLPICRPSSTMPRKATYPLGRRRSINSRVRLWMICQPKRNPARRNPRPSPPSQLRRHSQLRRSPQRLLYQAREMLILAVMRKMMLLSRRRLRPWRTRSWRRTCRRSRKSSAKSWWPRDRDSYSNRPSNLIRIRRSRHRNSKRNARRSNKAKSDTN